MLNDRLSYELVENRSMLYLSGVMVSDIQYFGIILIEMGMDTAIYAAATFITESRIAH